MSNRSKQAKTGYSYLYQRAQQFAVASASDRSDGAIGGLEVAQRLHKVQYKLTGSGIVGREARYSEAEQSPGTVREVRSIGRAK